MALRADRGLAGIEVDLVGDLDPVTGHLDERRKQRDRGLVVPTGLKQDAGLGRRVVLRGDVQPVAPRVHLPVVEAHAVTRRVLGVVEVPVEGIDGPTLVIHHVQDEVRPDPIHDDPRLEPGFSDRDIDGLVGRQVRLSGRKDPVGTRVQRQVQQPAPRSIPTSALDPDLDPRHGTAQAIHHPDPGRDHRVRTAIGVLESIHVLGLIGAAIPIVDHAIPIPIAHPRLQHHGQRMITIGLHRDQFLEGEELRGTHRHQFVPGREHGRDLASAGRLGTAPSKTHRGTRNDPAGLIAHRDPHPTLQPLQRRDHIKSPCSGTTTCSSDER